MHSTSSSVTVWGIVTLVRRRALFGAGASALGALLAVVVPVARVAPQWRGPALWLALSAIGVTAIVVASLLERGIRSARRLAQRFSEFTSSWE